MKTNIFTHAILAAGCAAALSGCDDNAWNDKLDGFEEPTITDVKATEYTLTADNYKAIAPTRTTRLWQARNWPQCWPQWAQTRASRKR